MSFTKCSKGFTLVELMVVVAIVAILGAVAIPAYHNHVLRTRQAETINKMLDLKAAQEMFYAQNDEYATSETAPDFEPLLSFIVTDSIYYRYDITAATTNTFTAEASGKPGTKFANNVIRVTEDTDPEEITKAVGFKFSLMFQ